MYSLCNFTDDSHDSVDILRNHDALYLHISTYTVINKNQNTMEGKDNPWGAIVDKILVSDKSGHQLLY